jgi:hypothetical protein
MDSVQLVLTSQPLLKSLIDCTCAREISAVGAGLERFLSGFATATVAVSVHLSFLQRTSETMRALGDLALTRIKNDIIASVDSDAAKPGVSLAGGAGPDTVTCGQCGAKYGQCGGARRVALKPGRTGL